jgi:hypothetical protein
MEGARRGCKGKKEDLRALGDLCSENKTKFTAEGMKIAEESV